MTTTGLAQLIVPPVCAVIGIYLFRVLQWRKRIADRAEALMREGSEGEPDWVITRKNYWTTIMTEIEAGHSGVMPRMSILIIWRWKNGKPYFMFYVGAQCAVHAPLHLWGYFANDALRKIKAEIAEFHAVRHAF